MEHATQSRRCPTVYKIRGPNTWAAVRAMYEAGATGPAVCEAYDVGRSAMRQRAKREGWRKCDLPDLPQVAIAIGDPNRDTEVDIHAASQAAVVKAVKLLSLGQFARASEAAKAADMIGRLVQRMPSRAIQDPARDAAVMEELHRKILALSQSALDDADEDEAIWKTDV